MSQFLDQLLADIKVAMKAREMEKLTALRGLHAQIKDAGTNAGKEENDALVVEVVSRAIKQRNQSIDQFKEAGRDELAAKEAREIEWIKAYQPEQLGEADISAIVKQAVEETGATSKQETGKVMAAIMPKLKGKADGKLVNQIVQQTLS